MFTLIQTGQSAELAEMCQAKTVELAMPMSQGVFNVDGEATAFHHNKILLTVHPGAFEFYVPEKPEAGLLSEIEKGQVVIHLV